VNLDQIKRVGRDLWGCVCQLFFNDGFAVAQWKEAVKKWGEGCWLWIKEDLQSFWTTWKDFREGKRQVSWPGCLRNSRIYAGLLAGFLLLGGNFYLVKSSLVYAVSYQGKEIAVVASPRQAERLRLQVKENLEKKFGQEVVLPESVVYHAFLGARSRMKTQEQLLAAFQGLPWHTLGAEIVVDGEPVVVVEDVETAKKVLEKIKEQYKAKLDGEKLEEVSFQERVALRIKEVEVKKIASEEQAVAALCQNKSKLKTYIVKEGDCLWSIARAHDLLVADLYAANPDLKSERLDIGQELKLGTVEPVLSIVTTSTVVKRESIPYEVQVEYDPRLWRGETRILQAGKDGEAEVVYKVTRKNGVIVSKEVVSKRVLKEPVAKVVARGTRQMVAMARSFTISRGSGSGVLTWPVHGRISSGYGWRGREFHAAIDIATSRGTPVRAAASGRVVSAGWCGGYGYTVVIDHGDGLATRYAHLSKITVRNGEKVSRGTVIGNVGSTGRSTGPHLHFEVMVNGKKVNPLNYLR